MIKCEADVLPNQNWAEDGSADVTLRESCNLTGSRNLPLKHFSPGQEITISRVDYPDGLVVVPTEGYPSGNPAVLPLHLTSGIAIILKEQDWPEGAVGMFLEI